MRINTFQCDECPNVRRESNHWWMILDLGLTYGLTVAPWRDEYLGTALFHLCGLECVQRRLFKELEHVRKESDAKTEN